MELAHVSTDTLLSLAGEHGTPLYVYNQAAIQKQAAQALAWNAPFGMTVRYAMKANPHPAILQTLHKQGVHIDASSWHEVLHAQKAGIPAAHISLNSQQLPVNMHLLAKSGVHFVATSLHQLDMFGKAAPGSHVGVRINPGQGDGMNNRLNTAGVNAGFGIWHEYTDEVKAIANRHSLTISTVHTHIGSGTNPEMWQAAAATTLDIVRQFPSATTMSLGGGFKVGYMPGEPSADMLAISNYVNNLLKNFASETGRELQLEIEPGKFLVASAGVLLAAIIDITDTGEHGHTFLRLNTGMNDILRPTLYGAQHPLTLIPAAGQAGTEKRPYVVIGHNCESGDIITPAQGDPESLEPRTLPKATRGDIIAIGMAGAYCASMRARGYNSYEDAAELFLPLA